MAAGAWQVFVPSIQTLVTSNTIDLDTSTFRMALVTESYTPNRFTHDTWSDISANEVANGGGYTTHGKLLTCTVTIPGSPGQVVFDCDDQSWTSSTITARYAVIVLDTDANAALAATDPVLCYCDLNSPSGPSVSTTNGTFAINIASSGVFTIE